jgi:hypothetical protein
MAPNEKPFDPTETGNWEALALSRVARHVEALPTPSDEAEDFGWEEGVLEKLRKRLSQGE